MERTMEGGPAPGHAPELSRKAAVLAPTASPRCAPIAERGIRTGSDLCTFISLSIADIVSGRLSPAAGNAAINGIGKLLKCTELTYKHGQRVDGVGKKDILLAELPGQEA